MAQNNPFATPELDQHYGGMIPSPPDDRDFVLPHLAMPNPKAYRNHDLRDYHGQSLAISVRDQGQVGSCTGFAWTGLRAAATARWHIDQGDSPDVRAPSPRFMYHLERSEMMSPTTYPQDSGADMRSGGMVLSKYGCALEEFCPYNNRADDGPISQEAFFSAGSYGISTFYRIQGTGSSLVQATLNCLDEMWPFVIAIIVCPEFEYTGSDGRMQMPTSNSQILGGHAVCVFGNFIDNSFPGGGCWIVQNQWSESFGENGWCYVPFAYATTQTRYGPLLSEAWTIR